MENTFGAAYIILLPSLFLSMSEKRRHTSARIAMNIAWHAPKISALNAASCMMIQGLDASLDSRQKKKEEIQENPLILSKSCHDENPLIIIKIGFYLS